MRNCGEKSWKRMIVLGAAILAFCSSLSLAADSITGVVHNQTDGRSAAGDEVILLAVGQNAQEEARAKTGSQGLFTLELRHPERPHLVRVIHQGVNYDRQVSPGNAISIDVADAAAEVKGVNGGIEIIRVGAHGNLLHISDMVEIKNDSKPPVTQASERTFEVYLPGDAKIESVLAAGPENIGSMISAAPVPGEPGHYTVSFPLRPGATKFAFNYDLPYDGRATFRTKNMYPLQQLAVMIPPTMTFVSRSAAFQILPLDNNRYRVEAAEQVKAGVGPDFEISGVGALPPVQAQVHASSKPPAGAPAAPSPSITGTSKTRAQITNALDAIPVSGSSASSSRLPWWVLGGGVILMLVTCEFFVRRRQHPPTGAMTGTVQATAPAAQLSMSLVEALKEGLFQLETDRLQGVIPREEYASVKQALEGTIQWASTRAGARRGTTHS